MSQTRKFNPFAILGLFVVVLVMSIALLAVMFLQKPVSELSLDTRKEAMVDSGLAELNTYPFNQSTLKVDEEQKINLQLNTKDKSLKSIELIFEVIADEGLLDSSKIKFTGTIPPELEINKEEVIESLCDKDCYTVTLLLNVKDSDIPFSTQDEMKTIAQLSFTPQEEGSLKLKISQDSTAIENQSNDDILQKPTVLDFQYYVTENGIDRAQCEFVYSEWGECNNGWQTRRYSVEPDKCYWYEDDTLGELSRQCADSDVLSANSNYFYLYSHDRCLNQPTDGSSLYVIWNEERYEDVTWIDVSSSPDFGDFYHKKVDGNIDQTNGDFLIVNAKGFTHATGNKGPLSYEPNKSYYFRLFSTDNGGQHISSARYYTTYCSGDQSSYKNCNDACGEDSDQSKSCAPGLTCHEGQCRNENNPDNTLCLETPGIQSNDRSCNQYCANNNDCGAGLTCFWNSCRNPLNLGSTSCSAVSSAQGSPATSKGGSNVTSYTDNKGNTVLLPSEAYDLTTYSCNQGCNNNRDCDADLRCYNGKCRLADDPENAMCAGVNSDSKGASGSASLDQNATNSGATISTTPVPNDSKDSNRQGILQNTLNKFIANFAWQWLAVAGAILLIAFSLIISSIAKAKKDPWEMPVQRPTQAIQRPTAPPVPPTSPINRSDDELRIPEDKPTRI